MLKKLMIVPWFGDLPEWFPKYLENTYSLNNSGYHWYFDHNPADFSQRVKKYLGLDFTPALNTSQSHNFRVAYGLLYQDILKSYDFWGITDLDCIYGDLSRWENNEMLDHYDIHSNHYNYICGPWTLFRNSEKINNLFHNVPNWQSLMLGDNPPGRWTENEYTAAVDKAHNDGDIKRVYTYWQGLDINDDSQIEYRNGKLYDHGSEIFMFHFNRKKVWPIK